MRGLSEQRAAENVQKITKFQQCVKKSKKLLRVATNNRADHSGCKFDVFSSKRNFFVMIVMGHLQLHFSRQHLEVLLKGEIALREAPEEIRMLKEKLKHKLRMKIVRLRWLQCFPANEQKYQA